MADAGVVGYKRLYRVDRKFDLDDLVAKEPMGQFRKWYAEAQAHEDICDPNVVALATATTDGVPSVRMVLVEENFDRGGFQISTEHGSPKARDMESNPHASLIFFWSALGRTVRVEGTVERMSDEESESTFHDLDRGMQILKSLGQQSTVIKDAEVMAKRCDEIVAGGEHILKPTFWSSYLIRPNRVEFWQNKSYYLVDRLQFRRPTPEEVLDPELSHQGEDGWVIERLMP